MADIAQLDVSDEALETLGLPLSESDWEEGLGDYHFSFLELRTGEQLMLRRFEPPSPAREAGILAPLSVDPEQVAQRLLAALELPGECLTWTVPVEAWRELRETTARYLRSKEQES